MGGQKKYWSSVFGITEEPHFRDVYFEVWKYLPTFKAIRFQLMELLYYHIWKAKVNDYQSNTLILTILSLFVRFCAVKTELFMTVSLLADTCPNDGPTLTKSFCS